MCKLLGSYFILSFSLFCSSVLTSMVVNLSDGKEGCQTAQHGLQAAQVLLPVAQAPPMTALPQGSALPVSSSESKGGPLVRHNNLTRLRSLNWRKGEEDIGNKVQHTDSLDEETSVTSVTPVMVTKKPSPAAPVKFKSAAPTSQSSCPRSIPQPSKTFPRTTTPKRLSTGNHLYNDMASQNGASVGNGRCGSSGPGVGHVSQQRTLQSKLSLSNDSIKSDSKDSIVRSQSFTYSKRATCPTNPPITRSFSFNKATELPKELPRPLAQSSSG